MRIRRTNPAPRGTNPARRTNPPRRGTPAHADGPRRTPFVVLIVGLVVGGMSLLLLLNTASAANELRRHDFSVRDASIGAAVEELRNEVAASAAPGNLAQAAAELGMVPAQDPAFLVIGADGRIHVMGSPGAASALVLPAPTTAHSSASKSASKSATATATGTSTARGTSTATGTKTPTHSASSSTPTPTPTPTPTLTIPGGKR